MAYFAESMAELYSSTTMSKTWSVNVTEHHLKSASLPPGLALPTGNQLSRSRSNAGTKRGDAFQEEDEDEKKEDKKKEESFFGRFLARRSGKKQTKKSKSEDIVKTETVASYKQVDERRTASVDEIEHKFADAKTESANKTIDKTEKCEVKFVSKTENVFSYKQIEENKNEKHLRKMKSDELSMSKTSESDNKQIKKIKSEDLTFVNNKQTEAKKIKTDEFNNQKLTENAEKQIKKLKSEENDKIKLETQEKSQSKKLIINKAEDINENLPEKSPKKIIEEFNITKINENLFIEKLNSKKLIIKSDDEKKKMKSDDYILIKTNDSLSLYKNEERKNSIDSNLRNSIAPRTGPASRQRIQPIDIPASPDSFRHKRQIDPDTKNSPEKSSNDQRAPPKPIKTPSDSFQLLNSPPKQKIFQITRQIKIGDDKTEVDEHNEPPQISPKPLWAENFSENKFEEKTKVRIAGLSSYQQKVLTYDDYDNGFKSLSNDSFEDNVSKVTKSHSFGAKTENITYITKSETFNSIKTSSPVDDRKSIDSEIYDSLNKNEPLSFTSHSDSLDGDNKNDEQQKSNVTDGNVTVSCVNSQILSSVNSNQVIVSISAQDDHNAQDTQDTQNQVSMVTRVQLKRDNKNNESAVPEFLKIQLNKVDIKPVSNVVLSTAQDTEEKYINENKDNDNGRKFSKDDVEVIEKEEANNNNNVNSKTEKQNTVILIGKPSLTSAVCKPFLKKKSNSIELSETDVKELRESSEKTGSTEQLIKADVTLRDKTVSAGDITEGSEPVILRRKSSASAKRDKDANEEPELMKVFARRSLKLKDSEAETLSQQVMILVENSQMDDSNYNNSTGKSRDSDKENEFADSPQEERKKINFQQNNLKDAKPLNESKFVETEVTLRKPINNKIAAFSNNPRFQKSSSLLNSPPSSTDNQDARRNKSVVEARTEKPKVFEKNINRTTKIVPFKDKEMDVKKSSDVIIKTEVNNKCVINKTNDDVITNLPLKSEFENEEYVPMFKRISQRKEEWEQRAQQAMKKTVP